MRVEEEVDQAGLGELERIAPEVMIEDLEQISETPGTALRDLYKRWERQNWSAYDLDFTKDAADWKALEADVVQRLLWVMTMFFHGEDCVTATLGPWVDSAPTQEMQIFLSTQVADEARHTVFFDRFYEEVVGASGNSLKARLEGTADRVNPAFHQFFRELLPQISREVGSRPGDPVTYARGICFYHFITEGLLAVPGQRYLLDFARGRDILPGFRAGFTAVARDESRHVGGGVRILRELISMEPDCVGAVQDIIKESLPLASQMFQPPDNDFTYFSVLGYDIGELFRFALNSLGKRMRSAGIPMPRIGPMRLPAPDGPAIIPEKELTAVQKMLRPMRDEVTSAAVFQGLPVAFNPEAARGVNLSYEFTITPNGNDAGGVWTVVIDDGSLNVLEGPGDGEPDQRLEMDADTWRGISVGDMVGNEAFLLGKVTVEGFAAAGPLFDDYFQPTK